MFKLWRSRSTGFECSETNWRRNAFLRRLSWSNAKHKNSVDEDTESGCDAMSTLVVVAHPDDEVLGFGGAGSLLAKSGVEIRCCFLSGSVTARQRRPADQDLLRDTHEAQEILGFQPPILGDFPNIAMNSIPHIELVKFIEMAITKHRATTIITHHPGDINDDHRQVGLAALAAARLHQRGSESGVGPLDAVVHMEILSSTDWQFPTAGERFSPDTYFEIGEEGLRSKLSALAAYRDVMRPYPHPRSAEAVRALSVIRGAESGCNLAEAFQTAHRRWRPEKEML